MSVISTNEIVATLSSRVGKPFSIPLQEELKRIINYKRMNYMQQFIQTHPEQRHFFTQQFVATVEKVNTENDICGLTTSTKCPILRTVEIVPQPLRNSHTLFDYVGYADFSKNFNITRPEFLTYTAHDKFTSKNTKYYYVNNRVYVYNDLHLNYIGIRGIFEDPQSVNSCSTEVCYTDDSPFPAPQDIINAIIRDILQVELRKEFPEVAEVEVDKPKQNPLADGQ